MSEPLKRYDLVTNYRAGSSIEEMELADDGEWVRWESVEERVRALEAEREALKRQLAHLREDNESLRAALVYVVNHPHNSYEHPANQGGSPDSNYSIGVTDGHRCVASYARQQLDDIDARERLRDQPARGQAE